MVSGSQCSPRVERVLYEDKSSEFGLLLRSLHFYSHESTLRAAFGFLATVANFNVL